jgi:type I restriction enzyme, S subunit
MTEVIACPSNRDVFSCWAKAAHNRNENRAPAETRDYRLPKLMSGQLRVRDAEKMVEDAP